MKKILIQNEKEYRDFVSKTLQYFPEAERVLNVSFPDDYFECWDYDAHGNPINEHGEVLPISNMGPNDFSIDIELKYPFVFVYHFEKDFDRLGSYSLFFGEYVFLSDFEK